MKKLNRALFLILPLLSAGGCASMKRQEPVPKIADMALQGGAVVNSDAGPEAVPGSYADIPIMTNTHVAKWISYFQGRGRHHMERYLTRSTRYMSLMQEILRKHGLPEDLIYVPLIESGFSSTAHSHASAVGYWQFIRGTGKRYGLRIDGYVDERRDPVLSTEAAAEYFKSLYSLFGDWYLALAAYNVGENRVKSAVMRYNTRDFWRIVELKKLPRETRNYVPKFLAASIIAKDPKRFGFDNVDYSPELKYDEFEVTQPISLMTLATQIDLPYEELKKMNPRYRTDYVPIYDGKASKVRVPVGYQNAAVAALPASFAAQPRVVVREYFYYRVRRGDTLSGIAARHRTSVSKIKDLNNLGRRNFLRVGQKLRVPERYGAVARYTADEGSSSFEESSDASVATAAVRAESAALVAASDDGDFFTYTVQQGDTLYTIAQKHRVSIHQIKRLNGMGRRSLLKIGQTLKIPGRQASGSSNRFHKVKRGENLVLIAQKYSLSVDQLRRWNDLKKGQSLTVGRVLKLKEPRRTRSARYHVVRRGETLTELSRKYGVAISSLVRANDLSSRANILVGARLVIPE